MKKIWVILSLIVPAMFLFTAFYSINANAGNAGVGVQSPPPQFSIIRLVQQDTYIRVYITVSDINSYEDISSVSIILEDFGTEKARFLYEQYVDDTSWDKINEFSERSEDNNLLVTKKCSCDHSDVEETLEGCYLNLLFVFQTTGFTRLNIIASDRGGATANMQLDYSAEDLMRSGNIIVIPGINESMSIELPSYLLDIIALALATVGTWYVVKKTDVGKIMRTIYEKNS